MNRALKRRKEAKLSLWRVKFSILGTTERRRREKTSARLKEQLSSAICSVRRLSGDQEIRRSPAGRAGSGRAPGPCGCGTAGRAAGGARSEGRYTASTHTSEERSYRSRLQHTYVMMIMIIIVIVMMIHSFQTYF